jgi:hypothetical protein
MACCRDRSYFFARGKFFDTSCNISQTMKYAAQAADEGGCIPPTSARKGCPARPSVLISHTWIETLDFDDPNEMRKVSLLLRAWMFTQDLRRSQFVLWASSVLPKGRNASMVPWFAQFAPYVSLRLFDYDKQIASTPLALSQHFSTWERFHKSTHGMLALQSDVFRNVILFNYGGLWLDTDSVPLRDMWDISAGLGVQFIPKFSGLGANGHVLYVRCPQSALSRRRLEHITMFPGDHIDAWPAAATSWNEWIYNDALSEYVRASQALRYNLSRDGEEIAYQDLPDIAWEDLEIAYPMKWFDHGWACAGLTNGRNNTAFRKMMTACDSVYIWHRLTKWNELDPYSGGDRFWNEMFDGPAHDYTLVRRNWPLRPRALTGGRKCRKYVK